MNVPNPVIHHNLVEAEQRARRRGRGAKQSVKEGIKAKAREEGDRHRDEMDSSVSEIKQRCSI